MVRGSGAIFGAADWVYTMIPQDEDRTKMLIRCIKAFRRKTEDFQVALTVDGLVLDRSEPKEGETKTRQRMFDALRWAPINSMSVVQYTGARHGLLTKVDIEGFLKKAPADYVPKEI